MIPVVDTDISSRLYYTEYMQFIWVDCRATEKRSEMFVFFLISLIV
jgi:hypothetical protein